MEEKLAMELRRAGYAVWFKCILNNITILS
jgi:hypothetical protein